jgi:hypothetical protein
MQLFTIGLHELNLDGTDMRDKFGRVMKTYTNLDVIRNARVMTGFSFTGRRGNVEELFRSEKSRQDPLRIEVDKHDFFPKSSVDGGWIGDRYPLCVDLPKYHYLKLGAKFLFRGDSSLPMRHYNPSHWDTDESIKRFVLTPGSGLNQAFYEYIRQPCVDLSFYKSPKKVITVFAPSIREIGRRHTHTMCANPTSVSLFSKLLLTFCNSSLIEKLIRRFSSSHFQAVASRSCCGTRGGVS